jgi:hypothetical protein
MSLAHVEGICVNGILRHVRPHMLHVTYPDGTCVPHGQVIVFPIDVTKSGGAFVQRLVQPVDVNLKNVMVQHNISEAIHLLSNKDNGSQILATDAALPPELRGHPHPQEITPPQS